MKSAKILKSANLPIALTIAGFDPSGGAGVLADTRTFAAFGCVATAAITSITFQNPNLFLGAIHQSAEATRAQVMPLLQDHAIACAKTGMLPTREVVKEVARLFRETELPAPVVDPVMQSTSGARLMEKTAIDVFINELLSLACVVTPNISEAEELAGIAIRSEDEMMQAAILIRALGARAVLIKGGHLKRQEAGGSRQKAEGSKQKGRRPTVREGSKEETHERSDEAVDVLDNEGEITVFRGELIRDGELHGSGCLLSAAIAACLGKGMTLKDAVGTAKKFVVEEIRGTGVMSGQINLGE